MSKRPTYHHGDLRRALLKASAELLEERGLSALSLREVARRAGVTHSAPYHYFSDRSSLLTAVAEEGFTLLTEALEQALCDEADPTARFRALGCAYFAFALRYPSYFRIMFRPELAELKDGENPDHVAHRSFKLIVTSVTDCQNSGQAPQGDPMALVMTGWALVHGLASLWVDGPLACSPVAESMNAEELAEIVTSTMTELMRRGASHPLPPELVVPNLAPTRREAPARENPGGNQP